MSLLPRIIALTLLSVLPAVATAQGASFNDVPTGHARFAAVTYLSNRGMLSGYEDGTFRPDQPVNRAEAVKIIVSALLGEKQPETYGKTSYADVADDAWYKPYVETALQEFRMIDGPPSTNLFAPERQVNVAEFLKILLTGYGIDAVASYGELALPLASDEADVTAWHYPYVRYALSASMITSRETLLEPQRQLTRGDVAEMLYRFLLYRDGQQTQTLLSTSENELLTALRMMENGSATEARYAAARSLLAARGALALQPDESLAKGSVKAAEAGLSLAKASAVVSSNSSSAIDLASTAWHLADRAKQFTSSLSSIAAQLQKMASGIADQARSFM